MDDVNWILARHLIQYIIIVYVGKFKKKNQGISNRIVNTVWYFLTDRTLKVKLDKNYSETKNIPSNVQKGSVLGLLLLFIWIND